MTNNAKTRRLLGMPHWISNTQKVMLLSHTYRKPTIRLLAQWRVVRTKAADHAYADWCSRARL